MLDERGNLRITDRKKDMFIVGGFNAYPAEIENMISDHPAVEPGRDRRRPRRAHGRGRLRVRRAPPGARRSTADELIAWCRERMANYKVPRYVEIVDALPLNASGKVLKFELREKAQTELA